MAFGQIGSLGRGFGKMGGWIGSVVEAPCKTILNFADASNSQYIGVMGI